MRLLIRLIVLSVLISNVIMAAVNSSELKGIMVHRITSFIVWPPCPKEVITLVVYDNGESYETFKTIFATHPINGRNVQVKSLQNIADISTLGACDILCIGTLSQAQKTKILDKVSKAGLLVIGSERDDIRYGASITLLEDANRFKILVNPDALKEAHLKADYRLLKLAEIVDGKSR